MSAFADVKLQGTWVASHVTWVLSLHMLEERILNCKQHPSSCSDSIHFWIIGHKSFILCKYNVVVFNYLLNLNIIVDNQKDLEILLNTCFFLNICCQ